MPTVLVVGDVMTDIVARPEGPIAVGADTRAAIRLLPGGAGANQACWLAAEGIETRFAGRVGAADRPREKLLFAEYGVDARLAADEALPTGTLITLLSGDQRSFLTDRAANLNFCRADLPEALLDGVDLFVVSGYALFEAGPRGAVLDLIAEATRRSIPFAVDPASYSFLTEVGPRHFVEWTRGARFLFPNEDEAAVLTSTDEPGAQLDFLTRIYPIVAIKRGAAGAVAGNSEGGRWSVPAAPANVVDTSGAGDAFLGGFLGAYLKGEGIETALKRGAALGSSAVATIGARP